MKETYAMNEDGELTVTWEAETPEDMAELKEHALRVVREGLPEDTDLTIWTGREEATDPNRPILAAGLHWLFETEQPEGALLQHHGMGLAGEANRHFTFIPRGWDGHAVVVVNVADVEWKNEQGYDVPANPLEPDELTALTTTLAALGAEVEHTWNGHPATTGSLALKRPAHPSLLAAVQRYHDGCPEHPAKGVFCKCGWYQQGWAKIVKPCVAIEVADHA